MVLSVAPSAPASGASTTTIELAFGIAAENLASRKREDAGFDLIELLGSGLHQDAGDLAARAAPRRGPPSVRGQ